MLFNDFDTSENYYDVVFHKHVVCFSQSEQKGKMFTIEIVDYLGTVIIIQLFYFQQV